MKKPAHKAELPPKLKKQIASWLDLNAQIKVLEQEMASEGARDSALKLMQKKFKKHDKICSTIEGELVTIQRFHDQWLTDWKAIAWELAAKLKKTEAAQEKLIEQMAEANGKLRAEYVKIKKVGGLYKTEALSYRLGDWVAKAWDSLKSVFKRLFGILNGAINSQSDLLRSLTTIRKSAVKASLPPVVAIAYDAMDELPMGSSLVVSSKK